METGAGAASQEVNTTFVRAMKYCPAKNEWEASLLDGGPDFSDARGLKYTTYMVPW